MVIKKHTKTAYIVSFDSVSAFGRYVDSFGDTRTEGANKSSEEHEVKTSWDMGAGFKGALDIALAGGRWEKGAKDLQRVNIDGFDSADYKDDIEMVNGVVGGAVDIGAYLDNDPECFFMIEEKPVYTPIVRITVDLGASWQVKDKQILNRNRALLALVEALEMQGKSVELIGHLIYHRAGSYVRYEITLKHAGEAWSAASVAFGMVHPAFCRRLGFRALESAPAPFADLSNQSYGTGDTPKSEAPESDLHFNWIDPQVMKMCQTPETALEWVFRRVKEQNPALAIDRAA